MEQKKVDTQIENNFSVSYRIEDFFKAGIHKGHKAKNRNKKMERYIHSTYKNFSVIDVRKTSQMLDAAIEKVVNVTRKGGKILFVGNKKQARDIVKRYAIESAQHYVAYRWAGGTLTNWKTVSQSIAALSEIEEQINDTDNKVSKKEKLSLVKKRDRLLRFVDGLRFLGRLPDLVFVIDVKREAVAVKEASILRIPVIGITDTNSDPSLLTYPIPGNDDSISSIEFFCKIVAEAAIHGGRDYEKNLANKKANAAVKSKKSSSEEGVISDEAKAIISDLSDESGEESGKKVAKQPSALTQKKSSTAKSGEIKRGAETKKSSQNNGEKGKR